MQKLERRKKHVTIFVDGGIRPNTSLSDLAKLKNAFKEGGFQQIVEVHDFNSLIQRLPPQKKGLSLHIRAAIATAFGGAAAHSKLLADQEEKEIEHLMATIIEAQLNKIQSKIKHFEELESIMEKEYAQIEQLIHICILD